MLPGVSVFALRKENHGGRGIDFKGMVGRVFSQARQRCFEGAQVWRKYPTAHLDSSMVCYTSLPVSMMNLKSLTIFGYSCTILRRMASTPWTVSELRCIS